MKEVHGSGGTYLEKLGDTVTNAREDHLDVSLDRAGRWYVVMGAASLHEVVVASVLHDVDGPKAFSHPANSLSSVTRAFGQRNRSILSEVCTEIRALYEDGLSK